MLAVTQVLARLRYNDLGILALFGGRQSMIESPLIKELEAEFTHKTILRFLEGRFGPVPEDVQAAVQRIQDESALDAMTLLAARCPHIDAFRRGLPSADGKS
jgi:hypothetical protein